MLFAELLQDRVYAGYRRMAEQSAHADERPSPREVGDRLAAIQDSPDGRWLFRLWLELLAHAGHDERFVNPQGAPLALYPTLYEALFADHEA